MRRFVCISHSLLALFFWSNEQQRQACGMEHSFGHIAHPGLRAAVPLRGHGNRITAAEHLRSFVVSAILGDYPQQAA